LGRKKKDNENKTHSRNLITARLIRQLLLTARRIIIIRIPIPLALFHAKCSQVAIPLRHGIDPGQLLGVACIAGFTGIGSTDVGGDLLSGVALRGGLAGDVLVGGGDVVVDWGAECCRGADAGEEEEEDGAAGGGGEGRHGGVEVNGSRDGRIRVRRVA